MTTALRTQSSCPKARSSVRMPLAFSAGALTGQRVREQALRYERVRRAVPSDGPVVGDSARCPRGQCQFTFPTVPAGKRLLITSVAAQRGPAHGTIVLEGNGVTYFVTKTTPTSEIRTAPVSLYYEARSTRTARVLAPGTTQRTSLLITLVGELLAV